MNQDSQPAENYLLDQTLFAEEGALIDKQGPAPESTSTNASQKKLYLLAGLGLLAAAVLGILVLVILFRTPSPVQEMPQAEVTTETTPIGPVERQLLLLQKDISAADPNDTVLAFPPVNFKLDLQDATRLLQQ
jgi:hypothetical protein